MKTILLVEPDREIADVVAQYMHKHQSQLLIAHAVTAQEAIHLADTTKPEVVVLELAIPEHNGLAFLHEFRSYNDWTGVPVIIHSHLPRQDAGLNDDELGRLGVSKYLYKPATSLAKLLTAIDEVL